MILFSIKNSPTKGLTIPVSVYFPVFRSTPGEVIVNFKGLMIASPKATLLNPCHVSLGSSFHKLRSVASFSVGIFSQEIPFILVGTSGLNSLL